jgi:HAD superfamily hydrolase (TIGR01509 family)
MYGLIFDVDGVIADTEAVNAVASIKVFENHFGLQGVKREDFEAGLGRGAEAYMRAAAEVHGLDLTAEQAEFATRRRQANFLAILAEEPLPPFPGVIELMQAAMARDDFRLAIATSSTRRKSEAVLKSTGVAYDRMAYITGSDVSRKKPDPELFLTAAARIEVSPESCLVIEDAPDGVDAALAAGCKCIAVTNSTTAEKLSKAHRVVSSLAEVSIGDVVEVLKA